MTAAIFQLPSWQLIGDISHKLICGLSTIHLLSVEIVVTFVARCLKIYSAVMSVAMN